MSWNSGPFNDIPWNAGDAAPPDPGITGEGQLIGIEQRVYTQEFRGGFAWNMQAWNTIPWNGSLSPEPLTGEGQLIGIEQEVADVNAGQLIGIEQTVGMFSDGSEQLIGIEQTVELFMSGGGQVIEIEQTVQSIGGGLIIDIEQRVQSPAEFEGVVRRGWEAYVYLDGVEIGCLHSIIRVTRSESGAALMEMTEIPQLGVQDIDSLAGKPITCDVQTADGMFRIFTGKVDVPSVDLIEKKITLSCTDNREELINSQLGAVVSTIGYWSPVIFSTPKDVYEQLEQRLTTVPVAVDFDPYGNYTITSKRAKATADFVLTGASPTGVRYREPQVEYTSRAKLTNRITINFQYRFARLHHMEKHFSWTSPLASNWCLFLQGGYTLASRAMIEQAVLSAGWPVRGEINYTPVPQSGWYCGGIAWSTVSLKGTSLPKLDSSGNPITDANGNQVMETRITGGVDYGPTFANGAQWDATTRWAQTVIEEYTLVVQAPQSIAQYGPVDAANQYSSEDTTDTSSWEKYEAYNNPYNQEVNSYFIDTATSRSALNGAIVTAVNIAKTTILNLHRDTRVIVNRFLWPQIDLKHTVEIDASITNGGALEARGKVFSIVHTLDCGSGEGITNVTLALSRAQGSAVDSGISIPVIAPDSVDYGSPTIVLGNHYGEDPTNHPEWTGRIGNKFVPSNNPLLFNLSTRTNYPEQFIVDTSSVPDALRMDKTKTGSGTYTVAIPNDLLEITF